MRKFAMVLAIGIPMVLSNMGAAPAFAGVREDVAALMEQVRKQEPVDDRPLRKAPPLEVLAELRPYATDSNRSIRMEVVGMLRGIAYWNSKNPEVRGQVAHFLVDCIKSEPEASLAAYTARMAYDASFPLVEADFNDADRQAAFELLNQKSPQWELLLLAGVAGGQAAKERLQALSKQADSARAAHLALARMGEKSSIQNVIEHFENFNTDNEQDKITKGTRMLRNLAYIRQPAGVEILIRYLMSEERLPSDDSEEGEDSQDGSLYAEYALDLLAKIIEGFPFESRGIGHSDAQIKAAREWFKAHRNDLKIKH